MIRHVAQEIQGLMVEVTDQIISMVRLYGFGVAKAIRRNITPCTMSSDQARKFISS